MFWLYYIPIIFWSYFDYIIVVFTVPGTITYVTEYLDQNKKFSTFPTFLYFSDFPTCLVLLQFCHAFSHSERAPRGFVF